MCNFCHIKGNNPNSINHSDYDCQDRRNLNSKHYDPINDNEGIVNKARQYREQYERTTYHMDKVARTDIIARNELIKKGIISRNESRPFNSEYAINSVVGLKQPIAIVQMGPGHHLVMPIGRIGVINPRINFF